LINPTGDRIGLWVTREEVERDKRMTLIRIGFLFLIFLIVLIMIKTGNALA